MLKVAIDGRMLQRQPPGGVARIVAGVLPALSHRFDVTVLADARQPVPEVPAGAPVRVASGAGPRVGGGTAWMQLAVPRLARGADVLHGPWYALPFRAGPPSVVSLHDLTFESHPEWFRSRAQALAFRLQARRAARTAAAIVTGAAVVADEIVERYGVDRAKVVVIPNAVDRAFRPHDATELEGARRELGLPARYLLVVGGAPRRGAAVAVAAWERLRRAGADVGLVVVGEQPPERDGLVAIPTVDDGRWPAVVAGADALVYPTAYEGFGLPALEALASGTPVVCAPVGALPEVLGPDAAWCERPEAGPVADALTRLLADPAAADRLRAAGLARVAAWPGWDAVAARLGDVYEQVAHR